MNEPPFVVSRSDGFIGVEVDVSHQLTPEEAFELAARITTCAVEARARQKDAERVRIADTVAIVTAKMATRIDCPNCDGFGYVDEKSIRCRICKGTGKVRT